MDRKAIRIDIAEDKRKRDGGGQLSYGGRPQGFGRDRDIGGGGGGGGGGARQSDGYREARDSGGRDNDRDYGGRRDERRDDRRDDRRDERPRVRPPPPDIPEPSAASAGERKKLALLPRSSAATPAAAAATSKAAIFGAARPREDVLAERQKDDPKAANHQSDDAEAQHTNNDDAHSNQSHSPHSSSPSSTPPTATNTLASNRHNDRPPPQSRTVPASNNVARGGSRAASNTSTYRQAEPHANNKPIVNDAASADADDGWSAASRPGERRASGRASIRGRGSARQVALKPDDKRDESDTAAVSKVTNVFNLLAVDGDDNEQSAPNDD